jgi:hypothetical protein
MKRLLIVGLATFGTIALAAGVRVGAADDPPVNELSSSVGKNFVDADGDGVCDNCAGVARGQGNKGKDQGQKARGGNGPRDGSGSQVGRDGSGRGPGPGGQCDGTGPKGRRQGRRGGGRR